VSLLEVVILKLPLSALITEPSLASESLYGNIQSAQKPTVAGRTISHRHNQRERHTYSSSFGFLQIQFCLSLGFSPCFLAQAMYLTPPPIRIQQKNHEQQTKLKQHKTLNPNFLSRKLKFFLTLN